MASSDRKESGVSPAALLEFFLICGRLKTTKRAGWVQQGVHQPESVADHMYRMGMMALAFDGEPGHSGERLDFSKVVRMAIVHDLAESIVGDITPSDNVPEDKKHEMEESAMREITEDLGDAGRMIYDLFVEYERGQTPEAKLVKDFDKLDMIVQAFEYERSQGSTLEQFFESTRGRFTHPKIKRVVEILYERRKHECTHE
ncbi:5'-deoxynucleotidase [Plasmodiophora brassicae]|nr:hypothetical protein PBRA_003928 [Plasmodiophora brassicae]